MICSYHRYGLSLWINMKAPKYFEGALGKKGGIQIKKIELKMKSQNGFTLLELLICFVVLIIFAVIIIPQVNNYLDKQPITTTQVNNETTTTLIYPRPTTTKLSITTTTIIVNDGITTTEYIHHK
jgi:hypothetical protein